MMRIGLIIYGPLDGRSGGYLYDSKLVDHLRAAGHQVDVISLPWRSYMSHLRDNFSPELLDRLVNSSFDLLLQDELNHPSLFLLNKEIKKHVSYPIVAIVHHLRCLEFPSNVKNSFYRLIEQRYLNSVDGLIFNSATTKLAVEALMREKRPHVVAFPAGDRFDTYRSSIRWLRNADPKRLTVAFVGNIIPRKRLQTLIWALDHLALEPLQIDVIGDLNVDPFYTLDMMKLVQERHLSKKVEFYGRLDDDSLALHLTRSDVLVVPSQYEGFGIVYLEAMGFAMPVIGTTGGAAGELIEHGHNGFLIEPGDSQTLAKYLYRFLNDRDLLDQMGQNALQRYEAHPSWDDSCRKVEEFLKNMIE